MAARRAAGSGQRGKSTRRTRKAPAEPRVIPTIEGDEDDVQEAAAAPPPAREATNRPVQLSSKQRAVLNSMDQPLREMAISVKKLSDGLMRHEVLDRHEIGCIVGEIRDNDDLYGETAIKQIAELLGTDPNMLWACHRLSVAYTEARLNQLLDRVGPDGERLTYSHIILLAGMQGDDALQKRKQLETAVIAEGLSVRELAARLRELEGGARGNSPGRPPQVPGSVSGGIIDFQKSAKKLLNRIEVWQESIFYPLQDEDFELTDQTEDQLNCASEDLSTLMSQLSGLEQQLVAAYNYVVAKRDGDIDGGFILPEIDDYTNEDE